MLDTTLEVLNTWDQLHVMNYISFLGCFHTSRAYTAGLLLYINFHSQRMWINTCPKAGFKPPIARSKYVDSYWCPNDPSHHGWYKILSIRTVQCLQKFTSMAYVCYHPVTFLIRFYIRYCFIIKPTCWVIQY